MFRNVVKSSIFFSLLLLMVCCKPERTTERAFYFWKSEVDLNKTEQAALTELHVKKLYVKFFDVTWDAKNQRPSPAARIVFSPGSREFLSGAGIEIIPTVFITNETLDRIVPETMSKLGERIDFLLRDLMDTYRITGIKEVQIDCDWTEKTKDKYFELLRYLKTLPFYLKRELSATIRLYQCKYLSKTGVPPVNKGLLMCYNMGNLKNPVTSNSIIDSKELSRYIDNLNAYPLPLDIGLPLFGWKVLFRDNVYSGLIQNLPDSMLKKDSMVTIKNNQYELMVDTVLNGYELKKGDKLRTEMSEVNEVLSSVKSLSPQLRTPHFTVSLFHLDSTTLSKFKKDEIESIYSSFHQ